MQYWNPTYAKTNQHCRADDCLASIWTAVSAFSLVVPVAEMFYIVFSHLWTCLWQINDDDDDDDLPQEFTDKATMWFRKRLRFSVTAASGHFEHSV